ncbi:MAG: S-methyl-5'-thioinosine phosphorylase [bacterium]
MLAIIGGSGLYQLEGFEAKKEHLIETDFGNPSAPILEGQWRGKSICFLARHGTQHHLAPHEVNYRANIDALNQLGVDEIIAINAVGGIHPEMVAGHIAIPDQIIDFTSGREQSFYNACFNQQAHIDFTMPFDVYLHQRLQGAADRAQLAVSSAATLAVTQGPRLETAAEIKKLANDGCDLVGMTSMPEAALAREKKLAYACIALVVNPAAGLSEQEITVEDIHTVMRQGLGRILSIIEFL